MFRSGLKRWIDIDMGSNVLMSVYSLIEGLGWKQVKSKLYDFSRPKLIKLIRREGIKSR